MSEKDKDKKDEKKEYVNEAGGMDEITGASRPADLARRFIESLTGRERREIMDQLTDELKVKSWRHPIGAVVFTRYHRCTTCNGKLGDEVVVVVHRRRTGDHMNVFCNTTCLMNYDGWL